MLKLTGQVKPPNNEFEEFASEYFSRCKKQFDNLDTMTAKWNFEDLIPGLSDFDSRLVVSDDVGPEQMIALDRAVGQVHADLCRTVPRWSRILEHTPGIAITWDELLDPRLYNTETRTWSAYLGDIDRFREYESYLASLAWQARDEHFFLKKFCYYFSPYQRGIDPPINLGIFEPEYDWHSRAMHYFTPAIQAAASVITKRCIRGKCEAIRIWKKMLPAETVFDTILAMAENQYASVPLGDDNALRQFEEELFEVLGKIKHMVLDATTIFTVKADDEVDVVRRQLKEFPTSPLADIFYGVRFARIRESRYIFYLEAPDYFATQWLLENELVKWNRDVLMRAILASYGRLKCGKDNAELEEIIEAAHPNVIDDRQVEVLRQMSTISLREHVPGKEHGLVREIIPLWPEYYVMLEAILQDAKNMSPGGRVGSNCS